VGCPPARKTKGPLIKGGKKPLLRTQQDISNLTPRRLPHFLAGLFILVLLQVSIPRSSLATVVSYLSSEDLVHRADLIVIGSCVEKTSEWGAKSERIFTYVRITPEKCLKGGRCPSEVIVRQVGGRVGALALTIPGTPKFEPSEKVILFLKETPSAFYQVIGLSQGKFTIIHKGKSGKSYVKRDLRDLKFAKKMGNDVFIEEANNRESESTLEDFIKEIKSYLLPEQQ
jgi:hypothetical protein